MFSILYRKLIFGILLTASAFGQYSLPSDRQIPWSAGSDQWNGGTLPTFTSVTCTGLVGDGVTNDAAALQVCINNANSGTAPYNTCVGQCAVFVPAGTYLINSKVRLKTNVVLRGAKAMGGPPYLPTADAAATTFKFGASGNFDTQNFSFSTHLSPATSFNTNTPGFVLTGSPQKGDTTVTISTGSPNTNDWIAIFGNDDPTFVNATGSSGKCQWCADNTGFHVLQQIVQITNKVGLVLTLSRPLYFTPYTPTNQPGDVTGAQYRIMTFPTQRAGFENLRVDGSGGDVGANPLITFQGCLQCWTKGVETYDSGSSSNADHVRFMETMANEMRNSSAHDGRSSASGSNYGVHPYFVNSDLKIENNIFFHNRHSVAFEGGGSGSAVLYNYINNNYTDDLTYLGSARTNHGAHPYMILWEGNAISHLTADDIWGTSSHEVLFRNWLWGDETGTGVPSYPPSSGFAAIDVYGLNTYYSFVGNVLGHTGLNTVWNVATLRGNAPFASPSTPIVYSYGAASGSIPSPNTTSLNHGNFDYKTSGVAYWEGGANHTLSSSLYYGSKPAFFGACLWPTYGPEGIPLLNTLPAIALDAATVCSIGSGGTIVAGTASSSGNIVIGGIGTQLVLNSVTVSPSNPIIPFTAAQSFSASGLYSDSSTADLTSVATWTSSNPSVANNLAACSNPGCATFQCVARGVVTITATYQSVSGNTTLNCQSPTFTPQGTINVTQGSSSVTIVQFVGANGTAPFTFSSSDLPGFLSLSNTGCSGSQVNCSLVGTPSTVGVFNFHIQATDNLGNQACTAPGCVVGVNVVASAAEDNTYCNSSEVVIGQPNDPPAAPIQNCNYTAIAGTTLGGTPTTIFVCPVGEKTNTVAIPGCAGAPQPVGNMVPACNQPGGAGTPYYCSMVQSAVNLVANTTGCGSDIRIYATIDSALPGSAMNIYTEPTVVAPSAINCGPDFTQPWWYIRTTEFAKLPPAGNRISPAWAGITSINGRPSYSQTNVFSPTVVAGTYMPMLRAEVRSNGSTFLASQAGATLSGLRIMGVVIAAAHARDTGTDLYGNTVCPLNSAGTPQCTPGGSGGLVLLGCNVVGGNFCGSPGGQHNIMDRVILSGCDNLTMSDCYDAMEVHTLFAGGSHLSLIDSYTLHGFCIYLNGPCVDSKSIGGGSSQNGHNDVAVKVVNNYLEASGECIIIGGGTNSSGFFPTDWEFRRNHCYKPLTWKADRPEFGTGGIRDTYAAFSNNATAYSGATTCSVDPPVFGGTTATCHPVVIAGSIADVIIDNPGSGYGLQKKGNGTFVKYPNFYFTDGGVTYTSCGNQLSGDVNTNGTAVTWFDGDKFKGGLAGTNVTINSVNYLVDTVNNGTSITIHTSAGVQTNVPYSSNFNVRGDCIQPVLGIPNVKNLFELKHMKRMLSEGNIGENNWAGQSDQSGLCCLISPKNANNGCPTCTVEDITIRYNFYRNMTSGWQIAISVATQGQTLPAFMKNISLHDNYMDDMNGPLWTTGTAMIPSNAGLAIQLENANPQAGASSKIKLYHDLFLATLPSGFTSTGGSLMNVSGGCNYDKNGTTPALMTYITMEDTIGAGGVRQTSSNTNGCVNCTNNACTYAGKGPTETALRQLFQNDFDLPITGGTSYANGQINAISINSGIVNTSGTNVDLVSGHPFIAAMAGNLITINKLNYTVATFNSSTNLTLTASAGTQTSKSYNTGAYTCASPPTACTVVGGLATGGVAATCSMQTSGTAISKIFPKDTGQKYASTPTISFNGTCTQIPFASAWVAGLGNPKDSAYCWTHNVSLTAAWNGELGMTPLPQTNGDPVNGVCDGVGHNNTDILGVPVTAATWADVGFVNYNTDTGTGAECSTISTACTNGQPPGTGDLHLKTLSNFRLGATDGRDIGPDADKVIGKSDGTAPSPYTGITIDPVNKVLVLPQ